MSTTKKKSKVSDEINSETTAIVGSNPGKLVAPPTRSAPVDLEAWGVPAITAKDIVIPKILAMQGLSKAVTSGEAKFGEFRDSLNGVIVGDLKNPVEFVPFHMEKVYVVLREKEGMFKFHHQEPITASNEDHPFESVTEDGFKEKWYRTMNFFVLLPKEIAEGVAIPYLLAFRSSSVRAGQKLATTMYMKNLKASKTPASMVMELSGQKTSNDKGTYVVMDVKEKRPSTQKEVNEAFEWVKTVRAGQVKVDHSDLEKEAVGGSQQAEVVEPDSSDY